VWDEAEYGTARGVPFLVAYIYTTSPGGLG
jgi:hypothetical protein